MFCDLSFKPSCQWFWLIVLVCSLVGPPVEARSEAFRVIQLQHRFAGDILPLITPLLREGENVTGNDSVLILHASPDRLSDLTDLVTTLDTPRKTLKISVRQERAGGDGATRTGLVLSGPEQIYAGGTRTLGNRQQATESFLRVLEGEAALLVIGREVPFTTEIAVVAGKHRAFSRTVEYKSVTTGFWVRPKILGQKIFLEVVPHMMALGPQGEETLEFQELSTTVALSPGQWVDLGQQLQQADEVSSSIVRLHTHNSQGEGRIWIRVDH
ncbi:hypothetical protein [Desulfuromonas sp. AOP6]|uniref:hypothetical protein n=1 Tax=Desulfuromonas sp. AOP6 TaxID=1566351 RepID=UPI0012865D9F|nr:hypothetical protein [Desulfuromonas sp. AOP6]BCA79709.1 hypothetical protein AOP6_1496 [Desulfuromonas sp. AOP6]